MKSICAAAVLLLIAPTLQAETINRPAFAVATVGIIADTVSTSWFLHATTCTESDGRLGPRPSSSSLATHAAINVGLTLAAHAGLMAIANHIPGHRLRAGVRVAALAVAYGPGIAGAASATRNTILCTGKRR